MFIWRECSFLGHSPAYDEIEISSRNDQQNDRTEDTPDNDGYLKPHVYEEVKEPYDELKHDPSPIRDGVIDLVSKKYPSSGLPISTAIT